jgi:hypothetical protein
MYFAYRGRLADFLKDDPTAIVGRLHQSAADDGFSRMWSDQTSAWQEEVVCLQAVCTQLIAATGKASAWTILLEYEIARRGRRIDAVLLTNTVVVVLEFKVGLQAADSSSRWQAYEYGLDLRDFHGGSRDHPIVPIVVPTGSAAVSCVLPIAARHLLSATTVHEVIECSPERLAATILAVDACLSDSSSPPIDHEAWCAAGYRPSLNIIEAAERVFAGHEVREISHSTATNLSCTVDAVIRCITEAHRNHQRVVCFVTGVPGAGKTLAGLSAVHDPALRQDARPAAVFLSGNGPLVKIVRAALVRDLRQRIPGSRDGARQVATFIQNVHSFLGYYAFKAQEQAPPEHVAIFDEAQRAWDGKQMALKKRGDKSEAALMLEVMARCPDWSVIVALVGFGQEIHQGEAGLQEWGRAITRTSPVWRVLASPLVLDASAGKEESSRLFCADVSPTQAIECDADLHLAVSIRSHRAQMVSQWVKFVLEGNSEAACELFKGTSEFPVALTRDLAAAREWLRKQSDGGRLTGSSGLLASSGALRLRAYGIEVSSGFRRGYPYEEWFLRAADDTRSSSSLEVAATEFECQGLELDWAGVCWGDDMVFDPKAKVWDTRKFIGARWTSPARSAARRYILNKYRVLLTRARRGFVVWVPPGSSADPTRKPHRLDATAEFLIQCGVGPI